MVCRRVSYLVLEPQELMRTYVYFVFLQLYLRYNPVVWPSGSIAVGCSYECPASGQWPVGLPVRGGGVLTILYVFANSNKLSSRAMAVGSSVRKQDSDDEP